MCVHELNPRFRINTYSVFKVSEFLCFAAWTTESELSNKPLIISTFKELMSLNMSSSPWLGKWWQWFLKLKKKELAHDGALRSLVLLILNKASELDDFISSSSERKHTLLPEPSTAKGSIYTFDKSSTRMFAHFTPQCLWCINTGQPARSCHNASMGLNTQGHLP